jgi:CO/xanthine dehydrogenase FAD-binding subunit
VIMSSSEYYLAKDLEDALAVVDGAKGEARIIAGGTDLVLQLRRGERIAKVLVDITAIQGLDRIERQGDTLLLGALVTHAQAAASPLVKEHLPALAEACAHVGSPQIRNVGTLVGNIVSAQPGADAALSLHVFDTQVRVVGNAGEREIALPDLYEGLGICCVDSCKELITHLRVRLSPERSGSAFERLSQRATLTLPVVNAAVSLCLEKSLRRILKVRVFVGPVSSTPFEAVAAESLLAGAEPTVEVFRRAGVAAAEESRPRASRLRGGREYRKKMVEVMVRRALIRALERGQTP